MKQTELKRTPFKTKQPRAPLARTAIKPTRRPSEAAVRNEAMEAYGNYCHASGTPCDGRVQAAHIWGKGQCGPTTVENILPLCRRHHEDYDGYRMKIRREWLTPEHIRWLSVNGYVTWDSNGETYGQGFKRFEPLTVAQLAKGR